jgi:hypothetical protein
MNEQDSQIRTAILRTAVEDWLEQENPFSDIVFKDRIIDKVTEGLSDEIDENDVEYVWKLMTDDGYFRKRGKSRRITAKEIDEAEDHGVTTPMDEAVQTEILRALAEAEREDVKHPEVSRDTLVDQLDSYETDVIDYNLFYCRSKGWADVDVYISSNPWESAEITRFGRSVAIA